MNSAIGPYKGGLRFHPDRLPRPAEVPGVRAGLQERLDHAADGRRQGRRELRAKGKSEGEVMRFCQAFMTELQQHIGPETDVPAGDIGVGSREIDYLFGQYKRIATSSPGSWPARGSTTAAR